MTDTRAGFWLLFIIVATTLAAAILRMALGDESERTLQEAFSVAQLPCLGPAPRPRDPVRDERVVPAHGADDVRPRDEASRVVLAKVLAAVVISAGAVVLALLFAVLGTIIGSVVFGTGAWTLSLTAIGESFLLQLIGTMGGIAFGMVFLASAPAIVLYFVLPTIWGILTAIIPGMDDVAKWLDLGPSTTRPVGVRHLGHRLGAPGDLRRAVGGRPVRDRPGAHHPAGGLVGRYGLEP